MKILHLARHYHPHIGGVETHVYQVNQNLVKSDFQVSVICEQSDPAQLLKEEVNGVTVLRLPSSQLSSKFGVWRSIWRLRQHFFEADVIQVHDVFWWLLPIFLFIEDKVFSTFHGWEGQYPVRWQAKLHRWLASLVSQGRIHVGAWIKEFYWDKPDIITYGGVRAPNSARKVKKNLDTIVFVGRLDKDNDLPLYLELTKQLANSSNVKMLWLGDGEYRSECEKYGQVLGFVDHPAHYLQSATFVCAASYLSMLEAQAHGKIVVAAYSNPLKQRYIETFPGSKFMITGDTSESLAKQVQSLLKDATRLQQLSAAGQKWASAQSWEAATQLYKQLWQKKK